MSIALKRIAGVEIYPVDDVKMFKRIYTRNAIFEGCEVSIVATNQLHITGGTGVIQGGEFVVLEENFLVQLPTTLNGEGKSYGIVYIQIDLSDTETPVALKSLIYDPGPPPTLIQNENLYEENGIYEIPICKYTANLTSVTSIGQNALYNINYPYEEIAYEENVFSVVEDIIAEEFVDTSPILTVYNVGDYRMHNGKLYRCKTGGGQSSFIDSYWTNVTVSDDLKRITKPATVGTGTVVATSLTNGQVLTAPSDGVYQVKATFTATTGYVIMSVSNGQSAQLNSTQNNTFGHYEKINVNLGQTLTMTAVNAIATGEVKFFPKYS